MTLGVEPVHLDHVIPRSYVQHDEIWNIVLAHASCNLRSPFYHKVVIGASNPLWTWPVYTIPLVPRE
jgi:hypothetical protein